MTDGVVVLDKPGGITSFQAVRAVGKILRERKCGHAGTLDPMATGILPICAGRATKIAGYLTAREKEYEVFLRFGTATDTGDATGKPVEERPGAYAEETAVTAAVGRLVGTFEQVPPAHSAVKVGGVRSYVLARRGKAVDLSARPVTISSARLLSWSPEGFALSVRCSKGFYVRALPRDMRGLLGVPMTVAALRRVRCGPFGVEEAVTLEGLAEAVCKGEGDRWILPIERALSDYPQVAVPEAAVAAVRQGRSPAPWLSGAAPGAVVLLTNDRLGAVALVERDARGEWRIRRGI
ncbi:MAG: tRNA pseudouridine(55) synthase TruB [Deltaproteobacteria bacterium]|nr:tRNA pseudouridine(55) synthase TruB [Deltaproteobacteria bacterium]